MLTLLRSYQESLELLTSGNSNYTGSKGSESLKLRLQAVSGRLDEFVVLDKIGKEERKRLLSAVKSLKVHLICISM